MSSKLRLLKEDNLALPPAGSKRASSLPAGSLPAGSMPADSLPTGSLPAGSLPAGSLPAASVVEPACSPVWGQCAGYFFDGPKKSCCPSPGDNTTSSTRTVRCVIHCTHSMIDACITTPDQFWWMGDGCHVCECMRACVSAPWGSLNVINRKQNRASTDMWLMACPAGAWQRTTGTRRVRHAWTRGRSAAAWATLPAGPSHPLHVPCSMLPVPKTKNSKPQCGGLDYAAGRAITTSTFSTCHL